MRPVFVSGLGLWSPGYPNAEAFVARQADPAVVSPAGAVFPPGIRRRASVLTRAAADAFIEAARQGGADLARVPTVYTSAYGEIVATIEMLVQMATEPDGLPSPTLFHNSVHNTSAGYVSIATKNPSFSTSLAGGPHGFAFGLVEAAAWLEQSGGEVVLVVFDEPPPAPFAPATPWTTFAAAFHLGAERRPQSRARLLNLRQQNVPGAVPEPFSTHTCAAALLLIDAVARGRGGTLPLSLSGEADWAVDVEPL